MKTKLIPVMANCAVLLLLIGLAEISVRATGVPKPIEVSSAVQIQIGAINEIYDIDDIRNVDDIDNTHNISPIEDIEISVGIEKAIEN